MNNAGLDSAEHRGCARTSGPQLELEESTVHSIERDAPPRAARAAAHVRVDFWHSGAALIFCSRRIYVDDELVDARHKGTRKTPVRYGWIHSVASGLISRGKLNLTCLRKIYT